MFSFRIVRRVCSPLRNSQRYIYRCGLLNLPDFLLALERTMSIFVFCTFLISFAAAVTITQDTVSFYPVPLDFSSVQVNRDVKFSIFNYQEIYTAGSVQIDGLFYVTAQSGNPPFVWKSRGFKNEFNGIMVIDNTGAIEDETLSFFVESFENSGRFYVLNSPRYQRLLSLHVHSKFLGNSGSLVFVSDINSPKEFVVGMEVYFENSGVLCLLNSVFHGPVPLGKGCVSARGSTVLLRIMQRSGGAQTYFLADNDSVLRILDITNSGPQKFKVRGFGKKSLGSSMGSRISLDTLFEFVTYKRATGEVILKGQGFMLMIDIGLNYDPNSFVVGMNDFTYSQITPSEEVPDGCQCSFVPPKAPAIVSNSTSS